MKLKIWRFKTKRLQLINYVLMMTLSGEELLHRWRSVNSILLAELRMLDKHYMRRSKYTTLDETNSLAIFGIAFESFEFWRVGGSSHHNFRLSHSNVIGQQQKCSTHFKANKVEIKHFQA